MPVKSGGSHGSIDRLKRAMPSLEHLEGSLRSKRFLGKVLGVHTQPGGRGRQIADGFVRLFEKALLEYQAARAVLVSFLADGMADDLHRAQDHFESCVQSLHKAIEYLDRLRRLGYRREDGLPFIPKPRDIEVLREATQVRAMRDRIEHMDEDVINGEFPEDSAVGVQLGWEVASIGSIHLKYVDVARWIEQLHEFAALLSRVGLTVADPKT